MTTSSGTETKTVYRHNRRCFHHQQRAQQQQSMQQQGQAVSGLLIAMTADSGRYPGTAQENIIDLMVDSGTATHGCPLLARGGEPQLRTVTNQQVKVYGYGYGYKSVIMRKNRKQRIVIPRVIPFNVADVYIYIHQPILSVTRLENNT